MNTTIARSPTLVPATAQFDVWTTYDWRNGVLITELAPHDRVTVQTRNSLYEISMAPSLDLAAIGRDRR